MPSGERPRPQRQQNHPEQRICQKTQGTSDLGVGTHRSLLNIQAHGTQSCRGCQRGALVLEAVPTRWPPVHRAYGQGRDWAGSRRGRDQGLARRPCERVGGQQHMPTHVRPLHTLERDPGSLVYRLWWRREPCTKMSAITPNSRLHTAQTSQLPLESNTTPACGRAKGPTRAVSPTLLPSCRERGRCSKDPGQARSRMRAALALSLKLASEEDSGRGLNGEMPAD